LGFEADRVFSSHRGVQEQALLFEQVDLAVDFVLSKFNRGVGTRAKTRQAPVHYEVPPDAIREAIVNAIAHRDYASPGAVRVSVFADRGVFEKVGGTGQSAHHAIAKANPPSGEQAENPS